MINLVNMNRHFKNGEETNHILKDINISIDTGEFIAIMGPSGSGKSTLINILGFIDRGYTGEYLFDNENYQQVSDNKLAFIRNKTVGFVFQNFKLIQNNTIMENVSIPLLYSGMSSKERKQRVESVLKDVGIADKKHLVPNKYRVVNNNVSPSRARLSINLNSLLLMNQQVRLILKLLKILWIYLCDLIVNKIQP